MSFYNYSWH